MVARAGRFYGGLIAAAVLISAAAVYLWQSSVVPVDELVQRAHRSIELHDLQSAAKLIDEIRARDAEHSDGLLLAALLEAERGKFEAAVQLCARVSPDAGDVFSNARMMAGNLCLEHLGQLDRAEGFYREILERQADHLVANDRMVHLLGLQCRSWERIPYHLTMLRATPDVAVRIQLLMQGDLAFPETDEINRLAESDPDCAGLFLARAHLAFLSKQYAEAEQHCRRAIELAPALLEARAKLGLVLIERGDYAGLNDWFTNLPDAALSHPGVLYGIGRLTAVHDRSQMAARCFWESLRLDPNSTAASFHLGQSLLRLGRKSAADPFLQRSTELERYTRALSAIPVTSVSAATAADAQVAEQFLDRVHECVQLSEALGLPWDTYSWTIIAAQAPEPPAWCHEKVRSLQRGLKDLPLERTPASLNPAAAIDLSEFPFPERTQFSASSTPDLNSLPDAARSPSFEALSAAIGLKFTFNNGFPRPRHVQYRAYDFTGGGAGVIDVDGDSWPDVCLPQGCRLADVQPQAADETLDRLFRNFRGQHFRDVTELALPASCDYSQGVSAADYDGDGFPDLLIANLGPNVLLRNNGDGTFSSDTSISHLDQGDWTTSCLISDLNGDSHPDLYFVNYLSGEILTRVCADDERQYGNCAPQSFEAAQDQLLLSTGDGQWRDGTDSMGVRVPNGKGLGIIAANFDSDRWLDLFVANDGVPNFFFCTQGSAPEGPPTFTERAVQSGVATNGQGKSEACMGVVADYLGSSSRLALFVTNFYEETNTLYRVAADDPIFEDVTALSGLGQPSLQTLGFGTQVIDARLDGTLDIVVVNGHVDSYPGREVPYRMRPQYFARAGDMQYRQITDASLGPYFSRETLGRALARLDWNRDGLDDLLVTHLDEPAELLSTTIADRGNFLSVRLRSETTQRDAIGAVVSAGVGSHTITRQLTAGDGYLASNERRLLFGLGDAAEPVRITVRWPSGNTAEYESPAVNQQLLLIEGRDDVYVLPE